MTNTASSKIGVLDVRDVMTNEGSSRFIFTKHISAALLVMSDNSENFNKLIPKKHLKETVQALTRLKKCKLKTVSVILLHCIQRKVYKSIWCYYIFTVSCKKRPYK
jgi:hypothetical protein